MRPPHCHTLPTGRPQGNPHVLNRFFHSLRSPLSSRLEATDFPINVLAMPDSDDEDDDVVVLEAEDNSVAADSRSEGLVVNLFSVWLKRIPSQGEELLVDALSYVLG